MQTSSFFPEIVSKCCVSVKKGGNTNEREAGCASFLFSFRFNQSPGCPGGFLPSTGRAGRIAIHQFQDFSRNDWLQVPSATLEPVSVPDKKPVFRTGRSAPWVSEPPPGQEDRRSRYLECLASALPENGRTPAKPPGLSPDPPSLPDSFPCTFREISEIVFPLPCDFGPARFPGDDF